jgi:uncharacterized protein YbjT (DUF2867 family)
VRVLLTGANGFIGSAITALLLERGHDIVAAVRDPAKFSRRFPGTTSFAADMNRLAAPADWHPHLSGVDAVINCAGALHGRNGQSLQAIHTRAPIALFRAAREAGVKKIVQISAVSVGAPTDYAVSKRAADDALMAMDCDWVILRPSIVYGAGAYGGTAMLRAFAIPVIGKGDQKATPIHVEDLARTVALVLETTRCNRTTLLPGGPQTMTLSDMCQHYRQWLGLPPAHLLHVPRPLVCLAARIGDLVGNGPVTTTSLAQLDHGNTVDSPGFAAATGIEPRSMSSMLSKTPAQTGDLWQARLYLLRPLIRIALVLLWLVSGLAGLMASPVTIYAALPLGLGEGLATMLGRAASIVDLLIAALLIWNRAPRLAFAVQMLVVTGYTIALTLLTPALWLGLFGPLLKNIPTMVLIIVDRILAEER